MTPRRFIGSGPKNEAKIPGVSDTAESLTFASPSRAAINPPWLLSTAAITAMIPPIIIQTFAENAIKHSLVVGEVNRVEILVEEAAGIPGSFAGNDIDCEEQDHTICCRDAILHISIRDHGKGYPEETLEKIRMFRETGVHQEGLGLGIQNTIERMHLIYQHDAQVIFANAPDGGAMVELYLPEKLQE